MKRPDRRTRSSSCVLLCIPRGMGGRPEANSGFGRGWGRGGENTAFCEDSAAGFGVRNGAVTRKTVSKETADRVDNRRDGRRRRAENRRRRDRAAAQRAQHGPQ